MKKSLLKKLLLFMLTGVAIPSVGVLFGCDGQGGVNSDIAPEILEQIEKISHGSEPILTVGEGRAYSTIQAAIDSAEEGAIILVYPGTYEEAVCATQKTVTIFGTDRDKCILQYPNGDYLVPPLEMGSGRLMNMTVHATGQEKQPGAIAKAYALHIDYNISYDHTFTIENVNFINDDYQVLGIGLRADFTLMFKNCRFVCKGDNNAFYCHDDPQKVGSKKQNLIIENCYFENSGVAPTIKLQSQEMEGSQIECQWINNEIKNKGSDSYIDVYFWNPKNSEEDGWMGMSFWQNSSLSVGNSIAELNY